MTRPVVLMAGGGTGGHVFPMVAVAQALRKLVPEIRPVFVGTSRGMESRFVPAQGFELELLDVLPMRGSGAWGVFKGAARAAALLPESRALIRRLAPKSVFSIGGYAAGPVSLAARTMGLPVALMEPNSVVGLANLLIAPFVQRAYTAFELAERHFSPAVVLSTGVPLRPGFDPVPYGLLGDKVRVLVLGGSQGAKSLNEVLPGALSQLRGKISVTHQCGKDHVDAVTSRYADAAADHVRVMPFIEDMPHEIAAADLIVGRAGAGAVSEITAVGRPSLLIPYPHASGDHQHKNALALQGAGAAVCVSQADATPPRILAELTRLVDDFATLRMMARAAQAFGRPHAAEVIARDFLALSGIAQRALMSIGQSAPPTGGEQSVYSQYGEVA